MKDPTLTADRYTGRLAWTTTRVFEVKGLKIPTSESLKVVYGPEAGIAADTGGVRPVDEKDRLRKRIGWPIHRLLRRPMCGGHYFVHGRLAKWLRQHRTSATPVFLEVGGGDMTFADHLDARQAYNDIDYAISEFQLDRTLRRSDRYNVALASATDIPAADASVDQMVAVEVLPQIPDLEVALAEMRRVLRPGGIFACSIANTFSRKYEALGLPWFHRLKFDFRTLPAMVEKLGFETVESSQAGRWLPRASKMHLGNMHLPITSADERDNCYFLYAFRAV